jgi:hypothetical protein
MSVFNNPKKLRIVHMNSEENEEGFESERTLPLCFSSFKSLKQNVYNVSNQKSSIHDVEYSEYNGLANENHLPLCFSSFELLKEKHEITEEAESLTAMALLYINKLLSVRKINNLHMHLMIMWLITWKIISIHICSLCSTTSSKMKIN